MDVEVPTVSAEVEGADEDGGEDVGGDDGELSLSSVCCTLLWWDAVAGDEGGREEEGERGVEV